MRLPQLLASLLMASAVYSAPSANEGAANEEIVQHQHEKRQDYSELIQLASVAGVALPTDPAVLLSIAPFASQLVAVLPTAPVLSALETAAPAGFVSRIIHDPNFAASFESDFAAGHSPSWFLALPSTVLQYLHTYNGLGTAAVELNTIESVVASATAAEAASASASASVSSVAAASRASASTGASASAVGAASTTAAGAAGFSAGSMTTTGAAAAAATTMTTTGTDGAASQTASQISTASLAAGASGLAHAGSRSFFGSLAALGAVLGAAVLL